MPACESKLVSRSTRKTTVAKTVLIGLSFTVKKEGFGGGGTKYLQFHQTQGDVALLKPSGKTLHVSIGPGLPNNTQPSHQCPAQSRGGGRHVPKATHHPGPSSNHRREPYKEEDSLKRRSGRGSFIGNKAKQPQLHTRGARNKAKRGSQSDYSKADFMKPPQGGGTRPPPKAHKPPPAPKPSLPHCKALYDYDAADIDELSFREGDVIEIIKEDPSGWWKGRLRGKEGLFPNNYIEM